MRIQEVLQYGMQVKVFGSREVYFYLDDNYCCLYTLKNKKRLRDGSFIQRIWMDNNFYKSIRSVYDPKEKRQIAKRFEYDGAIRFL